ncbi:MAG: hypothetical protein IID17_11990, partial [Nitrospinae bacterium]|nr:hypothetical protein [Nitrospinota bacterium]
MNKKVGVDSNSLTHLIKAIGLGYDPTTDEEKNGKERVAMVRLFFHIPDPFFVPPTVKEECKPISDPKWREEHEDFY